MSLPYKQGSEGFYEYLSDLNLLAKPKSSKVFKPTGLGMLILGRNPQAKFPQSRVKFTIERENQEPFISEIEGPILLMPKKVEDLLDAAFLTEINRDGFHREELTKVSKKLLRELIINAIVHRDYTIEGAQIKVLANADKIEFGVLENLYSVWRSLKLLTYLLRVRTRKLPISSIKHVWLKNEI